MPDSMYDRLGDMLHDVLESGTIPVRPATTVGSQTAEGTAASTENDRNSAFADEKNTQSAKIPPRQDDVSGSHRSDAGQPNQHVPHKKRRQPVVFPIVPADVRNALAFFGLDETASRDDARKAYHEKLKYYHPDRHGGNPVLQKVAREKTRSVIAAWQTLERFFS
ncbi:MAG: J domain-containing protein [Treponemataceae bacterium]|nr:J domain-containing protein [Treponemataceae bacterium]